MLTSRFGPPTLLLSLLAILVDGSASEPDLSGNWIRGDFVGLGESGDIDRETLTAEGQRRWDAYDFRVDDPGYHCTPASWTRVWLNPNVLVRIDQHPDHVRLRYEFMDLDRVVPIVDPADLDAGRDGIEGQPTLGHSMAWYDVDTLVIDTTGVSAGYVSTLADWAGLPQSRLMHTVERIRRSGEGLSIEITHLDSAMFRVPFAVTTHYAPSDYELLPYGCDPEAASIVAPE